MTPVWVNSKGLFWNSAVNKRSGPSTNAQIVGSLNAVGEMVSTTGETFTQESFVWYEFVDKNEKLFWVRDDVFEMHTLKVDGVRLETPYVSQHGSSASSSYNDCGPASSCILLAHGGVDVTVNEFMTEAGITHRGFTGFNENIRGIRAFGHKAVHSRLRIAGVLKYIENEGIPVFCLVYYHHLNPGKHYGHFLVAIGYRIIGERLNIIFHDPYRSANMEADAVIFGNALANRSGNNNQPFQGMVITSYPSRADEDERLPDVVIEEPDTSDSNGDTLISETENDQSSSDDFRNQVISRLDTIIDLLQEISRDTV